MEKQYLANTDSLKKEYESPTEKHFLKLMDAMKKEQESNQNRMQEIAAFIREAEHSNRILIGESRKVDGVKTKEVRIVYNFVGKM